MRREITVDGVTYEVEFDFYKACRGARERGTGLQLEPDEPASVEITAVFTSDDIFDLIEHRIPRIEESLLEECLYPDDDEY